MIFEVVNDLEQFICKLAYHSSSERRIERSQLVHKPGGDHNKLARFESESGKVECVCQQ